VLLAAGLRSYHLGQLSFWHDEVVTMRLARTASPSALLERLSRIDATRAPLHPLLLQIWVRIFGTSEASGRSLSVLCGVASVVLIFHLGRQLFSSRVGLWAAWLAAFSPALVVYAREARMYAWLVFVTCTCWLLLGAARSDSRAATSAFYVLALAALGYSHPLGLLMIGTLALAGLLAARQCFGSRVRWLIVHLASLVLILPWLPNYLDHPPESTSGRLSLVYLLGTPIGFIGGNFALLLGMVLLIALGVSRPAGEHSLTEPPRNLEPRRLGPVFLLLWLMLPPCLLYGYSMFGYPVFGPQRYTLFVAPPFLILVAAGLARLPAPVRYPVGIGLALVSSFALRSMAYAPDLKADWRSLAETIVATESGPRAKSIVVIVGSADQERNLEVETARYYLPAGTLIVPSAEAILGRLSGLEASVVFFAVGTRNGKPQGAIPERIGPYQFQVAHHFPGLVVYRGTR
jgi:uncharacterized membrane protein